jgi:hypothetical protein
MNRFINLRQAANTLAITALLFGAQAASALNMQVIVSNISQSGYTSSINLGHTVLASTPFNRLIAGGTFVVRCIDPRTSAITGQRTLSSALQFGNSLYVTIPEQLPTTRMLPGFTSVPKGVQISCTYDWTARAAEATYSIGIGGFGITLGGEERADGSTVSFTMTREDNDGEGCIQF